VTEKTASSGKTIPTTLGVLNIWHTNLKLSLKNKNKTEKNTSRILM
jgi:hypothetical protein